MQELRQQYPLAGLLALAKLARSTFYYQLKARQAADKHQQLKDTIRSVFARHKGRYGYRRVTAAIRQTGKAVNHKTVQRLMAMLGLKSMVRPKKYRSFKGEIGHAAPNTLQRKFTAARANQKWVTDVTEFNVAGEKLYLSPILDLYNGEIVAFETARRPAFGLVAPCSKKHYASSGQMTNRCCTPTKDGSTGCQPINASSGSVVWSRACHAKAIASITRQWRASLPCSSQNAST